MLRVLVAVLAVAGCGGGSPQRPTPTTPPSTGSGSATPPADDAGLCTSGETCHHEGEELEGDNELAGARTAFVRGCTRFDHGPSCFAVGLLDAMKKPPDPRTAHEFFDRACKLDLVEGCIEVANNYLRGEVAENIPLGQAMLEKACAKGAGLACYNLGVVHREGLGTTKDPKKAYTLFEQACAREAAGGCTEQAIALEEGKVVKVDAKRALELHEKACTITASRCFFLGVVLQRGADIPRARALYDKACGAGSFAACHNLGLMLDAGQGGPKDRARAKELFERACTTGSIKQACEKVHGAS